MLRFKVFLKKIGETICVDASTLVLFVAVFYGRIVMLLFVELKIAFGAHLVFNFVHLCISIEVLGGR